VRTPMESTGKAKTSSGRSNSQWVAARLFSSLGAIFYWTPPGINLNAGQSKLFPAPSSSRCRPSSLKHPLSSPNHRLHRLHRRLHSNTSNPHDQLQPRWLHRPRSAPAHILPGHEEFLAFLALPPVLFVRASEPLSPLAGRSLFIAAVIHGSLWIRNHLEWNTPILGQQKETSGVAALGVLCVLVLSSLKWVRQWCWGVFYWIQ